MGYVLGIDLGTTFTAAAVQRDGSAQIASLGSRGAAIPSVVLLREDETVLTGEAAERRSMTEPDRVAREFKRRLGDTTPILLAGTPYSAEALTSRLLRWVVEEVEVREGGPPDAITVTYPANWGAYKIDLLNQAVRMADVGVPVTLITEPVAAAISYATQQRLDVGGVIAVFDLGGGTFDAAVLRRTDDGFEILGAPEGIERLGGIDFDAAVFAHVARTIGDSLTELDENDPAAQNAVARLRADCVEAKEALSSDTDASIPVFLPNLQTEVRLTRAEFESMIRPSLVDAIDALRRALRSADVAPEAVAAVLLVGGSSRIPLVAQLVGAELGRPVAVDAHPKHSVAIGAALAAGAGVIGSVSPAPATESESDSPAPPESAASLPDEPATPVVPVAAAPSAAPAPTDDAEPVSDPLDDPSELPEVPPEPPPIAPGSPGSNGDPNRRPWILIAVVAVLLAAGGVAFALMGGDDNDPAATPDPAPASTTSAPAETTTTTEATETTTTSTTPTTTTTVPLDEDCTEAMTLELWVCLETVRLDETELVLTYSGEFNEATLSTSSGMHLHLFGNDIAPENAGAQGNPPGDWLVIQSVDEIRVALDSTILAGNPDKVCALVADARGELVPGGRPHSVYDPADGNCLPIPALR